MSAAWQRPITLSVFDVHKGEFLTPLFPPPCSCLIFQMLQSHVVGQRAGLPAECRTPSWDLSNGRGPRATCCSVPGCPEQIHHSFSCGTVAWYFYKYEWREMDTSPLLTISMMNCFFALFFSAFFILAFLRRKKYSDDRQGIFFKCCFQVASPIIFVFFHVAFK